MNNVTMYTYTPTKLPPVDMPHQTGERLILTPELPFFWWLSPWKTCEDLQLSLFKAVEERRKDKDDHKAAIQKLHDEWSKEYHATSDALQQVRDKVYQLEVQIDLLKTERDAANDAVRTLKKKGRRG